MLALSILRHYCEILSELSRIGIYKAAFFSVVAHSLFHRSHRVWGTISYTFVIEKSSSQIPEKCKGCANYGIQTIVKKYFVPMKGLSNSN